LEKTAALQQLSGNSISVIGGAGGRHLLHLLRLGVTAFMTGTEALDLHADAVGSYLAGDEEGAARVYFEQIVPYLEFYLDYSEELLKSMLHSRGVIDCADVIAPRACPPMSEIERGELDWVLDRIGFRKTWPQIP
jgi:dihydrodipicolinate synthase/N-acetylneuraminate lyase